MSHDGRTGKRLDDLEAIASGYFATLKSAPASASDHVRRSRRTHRRGRSGLGSPRRPRASRLRRASLRGIAAHAHGARDAVGPVRTGRVDREAIDDLLAALAITVGSPLHPDGGHASTRAVAPAFCGAVGPVDDASVMDDVVGRPHVRGDEIDRRTTISRATVARRARGRAWAALHLSLPTSSRRSG